MRKVNYNTEEMRNKLIEQAKQNGEYLIEDAILKDEKYLVFDTKPITINSKTEEKTESTQTTREQINAQVVAKIRERYSIDDEFKMQRLGLQDKNNLEYLKYINYVQQCIDWGNAEKEAL